MSKLRTSHILLIQAFLCAAVYTLLNHMPDFLTSGADFRPYKTLMKAVSLVGIIFFLVCAFLYRKQ
jgi:hypothetical protein